MNLKQYYTLFMCICSLSLFGQYEGLDSTRKQVYEKQSFKDNFAEKNPLISDKIAGLDFMVSPISNSLFVEVNPFVGINIRDRVYLAGGAFASVWSYYNTYFTSGINATGRLVFNQIFLHTEYRLQYGQISSEFMPTEYGMYGLPIFGIGYSKDESSYIMVGIAVSDKFAISNPLGKFVYRIGFYF